MVFTQGCNFSCPYCHNPDLVRLFGPPLAEEAVLATLKQRRRYLDGVVISGGEPTIQPDLIEFCKKLQGLGYQVKLDTNGSNPTVVAELIKRKLINYLALDIKADPKHYPQEISPGEHGPAVQETILILKHSALPHEFRTTVAAPFIDKDSIVAIARAASGFTPLYLQPCRLERVLSPAFMAQHPQPTHSELKEFQLLAQPHLPTFIR